MHTYMLVPAPRAAHQRESMPLLCCLLFFTHRRPEREEQQQLLAMSMRKGSFPNPQSGETTEGGRMTTMVKLSLTTRGRAGAHPAPLPPDLAQTEKVLLQGPHCRLLAELSPETQVSRFLIRAHFCSTLELTGREVKAWGAGLKFAFLLQNWQLPPQVQSILRVYSLLSRWRPSWTSISSRGGSALLSSLQAGQRLLG